MREVDKAFVDKLPLPNRKPAFFQEKAYFVFDESPRPQKIGVLIFDADGEWGCVLLTDHGREGYRAVAVRTSLTSRAAALAALERVASDAVKQNPPYEPNEREALRQIGSKMDRVLLATKKNSA